MARWGENASSGGSRTGRRGTGSKSPGTKKWVPLFDKDGQRIRGEDLLDENPGPFGSFVDGAVISFGNTQVGMTNVEARIED